MPIRWTEQARHDLLELFEHIAHEDPAAARRMKARLRSVVEELDQFPKAGRIVPEFAVDMIRERIVPPYRIVYLLGDDVYILTVHHSRRRLPSEPDLLAHPDASE